LHPKVQKFTFIAPKGTKTPRAQFVAPRFATSKNMTSDKGKGKKYRRHEAECHAASAAGDFRSRVVKYFDTGKARKSRLATLAACSTKGTFGDFGGRPTQLPVMGTPDARDAALQRPRIFWEAPRRLQCDRAEFEPRRRPPARESV
jgi:hypothetical protein